MKKLSTYIATLTIASLFTACTHKNVEIVKNNDETLNCKKLTTQIANVMDINSEINKNTGLENKSIATWILWPPLGGINQVNASIARDKIDSRFNYLIKLKEKNKCKITIKERYYMKYKGRFSENINLSK